MYLATIGIESVPYLPLSALINLRVAFIFYNTRCWSKTYEECRSQLRWPTVQQRHQLLSGCQTFKIIHNLLCFNRSSTRSHSLTLRCTRSRINSFRYSFFVNIPFLWNTIPYDIVNSTSYAVFKYKLKSFLFG